MGNYLLFSHLKSWHKRWWKLWPSPKTLECIRGVHLDPLFCFLYLLFKRVKVFSPSFFVIAYISVFLFIFFFFYLLVIKKFHIGCAIFRLISINMHYCAMSQNLFLAAILKQNNFLILFQKCKSIHVLLLGVKFHWQFHWENGFQILVTWLFSQNKNSFWGPPFWNTTFFLMFFMLLYGFLGVYRYGASFVLKFLC